MLVKLQEDPQEGSFVTDLSTGFNKQLELGLLELIGRAAQSEPTEIGCHTDDHTVRVAVMAAGIAKEIGRPQTEAIRIGIAGFYHDVGKAHRDVEAIVRSSRKLTEAERERVRRIHSDEGGKLIFSRLQEWYDPETVWHISAGAFLHHHPFVGQTISETARGCLYPRSTGPLRLAGRDIPLAARVIAVADVYDALTGSGSGKRSYQEKHFTESEALMDLVSRAGLELDPEAVAVMWNFVSRELVIADGPLTGREFLKLGIT
ncbi:MAG: HD-GYP domain-containing protein [Candidatus Saccharibacteria bacterium]